MPEAESSVPRSRLFLSVLSGLFFIAAFCILWTQFGEHVAFAWMQIGVAIWVVRMVISRRRSAPNEDNQDVTPRHERVLSPVPAEAAKARVKLVWQFVGGLLYLGVVSLLLTGLTEGHFLIVFAAVTSGVVFTGTMLLVWATSWALRADTRRNQFSISTLLLLTTILAVYLGVIRLLADLSGERFGAGGNKFLAVAVICLVMTGVSLPVLAFFLESLVWLAAWLVRWPWVQKWIRRS